MEKEIKEAEKTSESLSKKFKKVIEKLKNQSKNTITATLLITTLINSTIVPNLYSQNISNNVKIFLNNKKTDQQLSEHHQEIMTKFRNLVSYLPSSENIAIKVMKKDDLNIYVTKQGLLLLKEKKEDGNVLYGGYLISYTPNVDGMYKVTEISSGKEIFIPKDHPIFTEIHNFLADKDFKSIIENGKQLNKITTELLQSKVEESLDKAVNLIVDKFKLTEKTVQEEKYVNLFLFQEILKETQNLLEPDYQKIQHLYSELQNNNIIGKGFLINKHYLEPIEEVIKNPKTIKAEINNILSKYPTRINKQQIESLGQELIHYLQNLVSKNYKPVNIKFTLDIHTDNSDKNESSKLYNGYVRKVNDTYEILIVVSDKLKDVSAKGLAYLIAHEVGHILLMEKYPAVGFISSFETVLNKNNIPLELYRFEIAADTFASKIVGVNGYVEFLKDTVTTKNQNIICYDEPSVKYGYPDNIERGLFATTDKNVKKQCFFDLSLESLLPQKKSFKVKK